MYYQDAIEHFRAMGDENTASDLQSSLAEIKKTISESKSQLDFTSNNPYKEIQQQSYF